MIPAPHRTLGGRPWLTLALLSLAVAAAYSSAVLSHYAYADDFMTLYAVHSRTLERQILPFYNAQGRPLGGWIVRAAFGAAGTIQGLGWARAADLALAVFCGSLLLREFRRVAPWWVGLGAVSLILLSPAAAVFVAWASSGLLSLPAAALALLGGAAGRRALPRAPGTARGARWWWRLIGAGAAVLAALLIYQPCACFCLLPAAIRLLDKEDAPGALRGGAWVAGCFALLCAAYFAAFQLARPHLAPALEIVAHRADAVQDVAGRLRFYVTEVLPRTFESWAVFFGALPAALALGAAGLLTLAFLVRLARTPGGAAVRSLALLLAPVLFTLASSPLLVVRDDYAPFRTLAVLYALAAVGMAGGVCEIHDWLPAGQRAARWALALAWVGVTGANAVAAAAVTRDALVLRSVRELDLYRGFARLRLADHPREVIFLLPGRRDAPRLCGFAPQHEFGTLSSRDDFNFPGLPCFAFAEEYGCPLSAAAPLLVHLIPSEDTGFLPPELPVVDAAQVLDRNRWGLGVPRSGRVNADAFFGQTQELTPALRYSSWFGPYEALTPTSIRHLELGALALSGAGGQDCWFRRDGIGWFWTNAASFPFVYSGERQHWLWYKRGTRSPPEVYDFGAPGRPRLLLK